MKISRISLPAADDVADLEVAGRLHEEAVDLLFHLQGLDGLPDGHVQFVHVDRLVDVIEGPALHGIDRGFHVVMGGDHDDLDVLVVLPQVLEHRESVHIGETDVEDDHVRRGFDELVQPFRAGRGRHHLVALFGEIQFKRLADGTVVIDHENFRHHSPPRFNSSLPPPAAGPAESSGCTGNRIRTRVPSPFVLKISTIPW